MQCEFDPVFVYRAETQLTVYKQALLAETRRVAHSQQVPA